MNIATQPDPTLARERVVVFGGLGFIGSHICRALVNSGYAVRIFDRANASHELVEDCEREIEIVEGDISRLEDVAKALHGVTVLINLIHTTVPGSSMKDPAYDVTSNVANAARWLELIGETNVRKVIYFSSGGTVYGVPERIPITEDHPTNPLNSYGITKLAIEKYTAMYARRFNIDYCLVRPSNVYGPGQRLQHGQGVIGIMASRALHGEVLEVWGEGTDQRDYLFIDDLVSAVGKLLAYRGPLRVFNISSGAGHSVLDVIAALRTQIKPLPEVVHLPARHFDVPLNILDASRLRHETGWQPEIDFEEGVRRTVDWLKR
ncbi:MAG TPA: SDR family NAD(P)-dependent oxidoreductase [Pyrinomonadaceae bacterium]